jgi:putative NADPH-quinone reductase
VNVLLVHCHPLEDSFVAVVRDRARRGLEAAGHDVDLLDLYAEGWRCEGEEPPEDDADDPDDRVTGHAARLRSATGVVLVYPTWWGGQPAMLQDWLDRVWPAATGASRAGRGPPRIWSRDGEGLRGVRRLVAVTTHGSPKWINAVEGEAGKRAVHRRLRLDCHPLARATWLAMYGVDRSDAAGRQAFLDRVEAKLGQL